MLACIYIGVTLDPLGTGIIPPVRMDDTWDVSFAWADLLASASNPRGENRDKMLAAVKEDACKWWSLAQFS